MKKKVLTMAINNIEKLKTDVIRAKNAVARVWNQSVPTNKIVNADYIYVGSIIGWNGKRSFSVFEKKPFWSAEQFDILQQTEAQATQDVKQGLLTPEQEIDQLRAKALELKSERERFKACLFGYNKMFKEGTKRGEVEVVPINEVFKADGATWLIKPNYRIGELPELCALWYKYRGVEASTSNSLETPEPEEPEPLTLRERREMDKMVEVAKEYWIAFNKSLQFDHEQNPALSSKLKNFEKTVEFQAYKAMLTSPQQARVGLNYARTAHFEDKKPASKFDKPPTVNKATMLFSLTEGTIRFDRDGNTKLIYNVKKDAELQKSIAKEELDINIKAPPVMPTEGSFADTNIVQVPPEAKKALSRTK